MTSEQAAPTAPTSVQNSGLATAAVSNGVPLYAINAGNEPDLRSLNSRYATQVDFVNCRNTPIQVWWLNFEGKRVSYGTVQACSRLAMNTYETHPWVIVDDSSKQALGIWLPVTGKGLVLVF